MLNPFTKTNAVIFLTMAFVILGNASLSLAATPTIPLTVTMSEAVNVSGTPRIVLDVGGNTRYATYSAGTGTSSLTFTYTATTGDLDLDGIGIASTTVDLNGGSVTDLNGNPETNLTFIAPANMSSVHVNYPSLSMDFTADADGRYTLNGTAYNDLTSFLSAAGGTFSRAGVATYFDSTGMLQTAASNTTRFDYDPVSHAAKGILIEESRTNLAFYSSDPLQWVNNAATFTSTGTTELGMFSSITVASTGQVWNRANMRTNAGGTGSALSSNPTVTFYYRTGTSGQARITVYNGTQSLDSRLQGTPGSLNVVATSAGTFSNISQTQIGSIHVVSFTFTPLNNTDLYRFGIGPGTSVVGNNIIVLGGQIEYGAFPTSFIPTTGGTATRAAETLSFSTSGWYQSAAHTLYSQSSVYTAGNTNYSIVVEGENANKGVTHSYQPGGTSIELNAREYTGVNSYTGSTSVNTAGTSNKFSLAQNSSGVSFTANGTSLTPNPAPARSAALRPFIWAAAAMETFTLTAGYKG